MPETGWRLRQQPALQGLCGITVLAVSAFHLGRLHGGWLGVELFFVLSGFLITALLLTEVERGTVSLRSFYWRRVSPLAPALTLTVLVCTAFAFLTDTAQAKTATGAVLSLAYIANWGSAVLGFDYAAIHHVWSLTIEEQYYLVWPIIGVLAGRRWARPVSPSARAQALGRARLPAGPWSTTQVTGGTASITPQTPERQA
ncbi:acyltransferase [uncultured Nocardioides sp.]|uniref:acyltransferase family protein n=1 Tax=uncultured Nocardioides sp. TaxID=198441 RepID=UPI0026121DC1|nr:acyltransferase [uncultured Nocardioides sp.]